MSKNPGTVDIHGKEYKTVALRVNEFRADHADWTINPTVIEADERIVVMRCEILDDAGRLRAAGQAEENRTDGKINRTSALENCETSAVGRALAFLGYAGSEIASADEVAQAINSSPIQRARSANQGQITEWINQWTSEAKKINDDGQRAMFIKEIQEAAEARDRDRAAAVEKQITAALAGPVY
jgi:hypothetical protein